MGSYKFVVPSNIESPPLANEFLEYKTIDEDVIANTESQDTSFNSINLTEINTTLHSLLQNSFYIPLLDVLHLNENRQFLENAYRLEINNDISKYLGEQDEFIARVSNLVRKLNLDIPIEFAPLIESNYFEDDYSLTYNHGNSLSLKNNWIRDFINTSYITKKWYSCYYGYKYILNSMYRNGAISLRASYNEPSSFSVLSNRFFKLNEFFGVEEISSVNSFLNLLPDTSTSRWPLSIGISGLTDYKNVTSTVFSSYDRSRNYDENVGTELVIKYDESITSNLSGKGLLLDIALDTTLTGLNSLNTNLCLLDNSYLSYINRILPSVKKVTETVQVGSELNLVATNSGRYIDDSVTQKIVVNEEDVFFTHPNVQAKFQIFKANWDLDSTIHYIVLGEGSYDRESFNIIVTGDPTEDGDISITIKGGTPVLIPVLTADTISTTVTKIASATYIGWTAVESLGTTITWVATEAGEKTGETTITGPVGFSFTGPTSVPYTFINHTQDPLDAVIPLDLASPVIGNTIEEFDIHSILNYKVASSLFYKNDFKNKLLSPIIFNIAKTETLEVDVLETEVTFPHSYISVGSVSLIIEIPLEYKGQDRTRKIKVDEVYSNIFNSYYSLYSILDENDQVVTTFNLEKPEEWLTDTSYSNATDFFPYAENDIFILHPVEIINDTPVYCKIDHKTGKITLKLQMNANSVFGEEGSGFTGTGNAIVTGSIDCSYVTNSGRGKVVSSSKSTGSFLKLTEVGLFNSDDLMVAYGVFPPIIYDSNNYYFNINCLLELPD